MNVDKASDKTLFFVHSLFLQKNYLRTSSGVLSSISNCCPCKTPPSLHHT